MSALAQALTRLVVIVVDVGVASHGFEPTRQDQVTCDMPGSREAKLEAGGASMRDFRAQ